MLILIVGDTHGNITMMNRWYRTMKAAGIVPDFMIQVGDFGFWGKGSGVDWPGYEKGVFKFPCPTYVVHGNHEDPKVANPYMNQKKKVDNLYVFPRYGEIVTLTKDEEEVTLFGVGGAENAPWDNPSIYYPVEPKVEFLKAKAMWEKKGKPKVDLLVTHDAPTGTGYIGNANCGPNPMGCGDAGLRDLWVSVRPRFQIGGHYHRNHLYEEDGLKHVILHCAEVSAGLLDTSTWKLEIVTMNTLERLANS